MVDADPRSRPSSRMHQEVRSIFCEDSRILPQGFQPERSIGNACPHVIRQQSRWWLHTRAGSSTPLRLLRGIPRPSCNSIAVLLMAGAVSDKNPSTQRLDGECILAASSVDCFPEVHRIRICREHPLRNAVSGVLTSARRPPLSSVHFVKDR